MIIQAECVCVCVCPIERDLIFNQRYCTLHTDMDTQYIITSAALAHTQVSVGVCFSLHSTLQHTFTSVLRLCVFSNKLEQSDRKSHTKMP